MIASSHGGWAESARVANARLGLASLIVLLLPPAVGIAHPSFSDLGAYEREALREASGGESLEFEPEPEGKVIGTIRIRNLNVFRSGSRFAWANVLHFTSTEQSVRQELTIVEGQRFVWEEVQESLRLLRNPFYSSIAVIVPLRSQRAGYVDLFVVTRDRWSLRTNAVFDIQDGKLTQLELLPADNNFLGRRKRLAFEVLADQGEYSIGPRYIDPNVLGRRFRLDAVAAVVFGRATDDIEGSKLDTRLEYPLWNLAPRWGGHVAVAHKNSVFRQFQGERVLAWADPITMELFPFEYRLRTAEVELEVVRQFGTRAKQRLAAGYRLSSSRPDVHTSFNGDDMQRQRFAAEVLPRSERTSGVYARYEAFKPSFVTYRNIDSYDLPEEAQAGPSASIEIFTALKLLDSEANFPALTTSIGWWFDLGGAFINATASFSTRLESGVLSDNDIAGKVKLGSPEFADGHLRVVARAELALRVNDRDNVLLVTGGETGLRGYQVGAFAGRARTIANVELRTRPYKLGFTRAGALVFWDSGHAAPSLRKTRLHNDVGIGLRMLTPQVSSELYRIDWAFALQGESRGWPGRLTLGFEHIF